MRKIFISFISTVLAISGVFSQSTGTIPTSVSIAQGKFELPKFLLGFNAGAGWRTAEIVGDVTPQQRSLLEELKSGLAFEVFGDFYFTEHLGGRLLYCQYNASSDIVTRNNFDERISDVKDRIFFIGPIFMYRFGTTNGKFLFNAGAGFGYMGYREKLKWNRYNDGEYKGSAFGIYMTTGAEYRFIKQLGVGVSITSSIGSLFEMKLESNGYKQTIELDAPEDLTNINILLGLRYYIK